MLIRVSWGLAGLLVLLIIGLTVYQNHLIKKASREASPESQAADEAVGSMAEIDASGDAGSEREEVRKQRIDFQKELLENPSIQESIRSGLEAQYKSLFEVLALSPAKQERLKEVLTNSAMAYLELNPEILAADTDNKKAILQQRYDYLRKETQLRVEALLEFGDYKRYQAYEDRAFSRGVVTGFVESLTPGNGVTEDQEQELIETMYVESQKVYAGIGYDPTSRLEFPSDMDPETVFEKMEITDRILNNSVENSRGILSESQIKAYNDYLRIYSENVEMSMLMLRQQYGE
jgi:hypothetical protein